MAFGGVEKINTQLCVMDNHAQLRRFVSSEIEPSMDEFEEHTVEVGDWAEKNKISSQDILEDIKNVGRHDVLFVNAFWRGVNGGC